MPRLPRVHVREPYWGAGAKFRWNYTSTGVSVKKLDLTGRAYIEITIGCPPFAGKLYHVHCPTALEVGHEIVRKGARLICFPAEILREVVQEEVM